MQGEPFKEKIFIDPELTESNCNEKYLIVPLTDLKAGQNGIIVSIDKSHSDGCRQLIELGVSIQSYVRVFCNQSHHLIIDINRKRIAADRDTAMKIKVQMPNHNTGDPSVNPV